MTTTRSVRPPRQPLVYFPIAPCAAPRQVRSDRWNPSPAVVRYRQFRDDLRAQALLLKYTPGDTLSLRFILPMPESWSLKKKREMDGKPHTVKPDLDNLVKAVKDSLLTSDSHVWRYERMEKVWGIAGAIEVLPTDENLDAKGLSLNEK